MAAAAQVFAEKGIEGASVEEISEAAGFTRGAFYSNFESKDDLCFALMRWVAQRFLDSMQGTVEEVAAQGGSAMDRTTLIDSAVDKFLAIQPQERHIVLLLMEMQLYALRHPEFAEVHSALSDETHRLFAEVFDEALDAQGRSLSLPTMQVIEILHAVHGAAQVSALGNPAAPNRLAEQLKVLLTALMR